MNHQEVVDIYDGNKKKTGRTKIRYQDTLESGEYIIGVQAIIMNAARQILISQRSAEKQDFPLKWECNGGALLAGEEVLDGLIREISEELGILLKKEEAIFLKTAKNHFRFKEIYLFEKELAIEELKFADGEVIAAKWVEMEEFMEMVKTGEMVYHIDFDEKDYEKCLLLLEGRRESVIAATIYVSSNIW